jgi:hypothetical protein
MHVRLHKLKLEKIGPECAMHICNNSFSHADVTLETNGLLLPVD